MVMTPQLERKAVRHKLERHVAASARARKLFAAGDHVLVAVSGGPDSVALLSALSSLARSQRLTLSACHLNYGLRGEESEEDAQFVSRLCAELGVPLTCERIDLSRAAGVRKGTSLQARARDARYAALQRTAAARGASKIALGHTADDQAETLVMWMLRGSGAAGLGGIRPVRDGLYVRPLLDVSRTEVLAYLKAKGRAFRTDSSNARPVYLRNRIRHELVPLLKQFNPSVVDALTRQAAIVRDEDLCLEQWTSEWVARHVHPDEDRSLAVPRAALLELPVALQRRVIRRVMQQAAGGPYGSTFGSAEAVLEKIVRGRSGSSLALRGARVARGYDRISFSPGSETGRSDGSPVPDQAVIVNLGIPSAVVWPPTGQVIRARISQTPDAQAAAGRQVAHFDAERFTPRLAIRSWKAGDVFHPQGMGGRRKKIQDFFCDIKLPRGQRAGVPLLVAPEGILWVVGYRTDHRFRVTPSTKRVVTVEIVPADIMRGGRG
ncbi:MAG: tRNA lysidine(34) synthetase TilS [Nitrospirae bacterium RIFCSPLOWO2_01_FULL_62_17]|nr:MAG: tRNA lysidine(34) synthetase TilS [Nitrospirae bacterium RIFCSPLOWO2_01_FULL_62_17]